MRRVGIVAALAVEAKAWTATGMTPRRAVELDDGWRLCLSGVGARHADAAARELAQGGADSLLVWGLAGGLDPERRSGDVLLPEEVLNGAGARWQADLDWGRSLASLLDGGFRMSRGPLLQSPKVLAGAEDKRRAHLASGAVAVDMESAAVASVAAELELPFACIKVVCDDSTTGIPPAALAAVDERGRTRGWALTRSLVSRPGQLGALLRLQRAFGAARRSLNDVARLLRATTTP